MSPQQHVNGAYVEFDAVQLMAEAALATLSFGITVPLK
jgi:hypothetical protein